MNVESIMSQDFVEVPFNTRVSKVAKRMSEKNASCAIVFEREQPIGIFTSKDFANVLARGLNPEHTEIKQVSSSPLTTIPHDADIQKGLKFMVDTGLGHIIVEKNHKPIGILAEHQIAHSGLFSYACALVFSGLPGNETTEPSGAIVFCPNCGYPNYTAMRDTCAHCGTFLKKLFSIVATPELEENLSKGLEAMFESKEVSLSGNTTVEKEKEDKWAITDGESIYIVKKEDEELSIYKKR